MLGKRRATDATWATQAAQLASMSACRFSTCMCFAIEPNRLACVHAVCSFAKSLQFRAAADGMLALLDDFQDCCSKALWIDLAALRQRIAHGRRAAQQHESLCVLPIAEIAR